MKRYLPVIIGVIVLVLIVTGFIIIQSTQMKTEVGKTVGSNLPVKDVSSSTQVLVKETSVPTVINIPLVITSPAKGAIVKKANLSVSGKTAPRAEVIVNEVERVADANGNFSANIVLDEGENTIVVAANDSEGNFAETEFTVTYEAE